MVFGCARKTPRGSFPCGVPLCGHFPGRWGCNSPLTTICDSDSPKFSAAVNLTSMKPLMSRIALVLVLFVIALGTMSSAQTVTLVLQEDVSSKLSTGTTFTAKDSAGKIYHGHVVTHPARRFLRRGSMSLVFDDPVLPVTQGPGRCISRRKQDAPAEVGRLTSGGEVSG